MRAARSGWDAGRSEGWLPPASERSPRAKVVIPGELPMRVYTNHYNEHWLHRALQLGSPDVSHATDDRDTRATTALRPDDLLGGLIHEYQRAA